MDTVSCRRAETLRMTILTPGFVETDFAGSMTNPEVKAQIASTMEETALSPDAIAHAIVFAIERPAAFLPLCIGMQITLGGAEEVLRPHDPAGAFSPYAPAGRRILF